MSLPDLGVGLVYWPALRGLVEAADSVVDVLEVEPQPSWSAPSDGGPLSVDARTLDDLAAIDRPKVVHSVGLPVGGTAPLDRRQLAPLRETVDRLGAPWVSEHLSFVTVDSGARSFGAGFLLPPRQTEDGIRAAVRRIEELRRELGVPFAVETAVNYLRPRADEIADGEFVGTVVADASCGLVLDLHNVWCNARNGRQPIDRFLAALPLDAVWEIHVAGGFALDGYWLDAHSGIAPEAVMGLLHEVVPVLPNLRAIVLEILPEYVPALGLDAVRDQLVALRGAWERRASQASRRSSTTGPAAHRNRPPGAAGEWEHALGALVAGVPIDRALAAELAADPGVALYRRLAGEARLGTIAGTLPLTTRLLLRALGSDALRGIVVEYGAASAPELLAAREAESFGAFLRRRPLGVPHLESVLALELAVVRGRAGAGEARVTFDVEPTALLAALAEGGALPPVPLEERRIYEVVLEESPTAPRHVVEGGGC